MYLKIDDDLKEKIETITGTDYDFKGNFLPSESIISIIEDLIYEIHRLEEEKKDREQDIENNYEPKKFNPYIEYGVSEDEFY